MGATVAITAILFHRLSFIKPDKLLKELLSDCCWYAARKQPSVSVSESTTLLSCARERRWRKESRGKQKSEQQRAAVVEVAVDGSLDFLHMNSPRVEVLYITSLQHHYHHPCRGRSDTATTRNLLVIFPRGALSQVLR